MQNNSFLKHFATIGIGTIISLFIGLLTTPVITRLVDPNEYGQLSIFNMYSSIAMIVLCLGMDQSLVRYYYEKTEDEYKRALLLRCIRYPLIVTLTVAATVCLLSFSGRVQFEFPPVIMLILCIYTLTQLFYRFSLLMVRLSYKSKLYSALQIIQKIVYVTLSLLFLHYIRNQDFLVLTIATLLSVLVCAAVSIVMQSCLWNITQNDAAACPITTGELLRYGYPFIITLGLTTLFQAIDQIAIKWFSTYAQVGIYASTMSLVHIFAVVQTTFNALWGPMAVEHYTNDPEDRSFYQHGNQIITVVMFFLGISLILCKDVFAVLLGEKYREAAYILPFLIFNPIMYTISETTVSGLVFMKKSKAQILIALVACITNAAGNMLLVPRFGGKGAAISTGISYIVFFTMRTVLSNRYFPVEYALKRFYLLTFTVSIYALYNTFIHFNAGSVIGFLICIGILVTLYRKTVLWCLQYLINLLKPIFLRQKKEK